MRKLVFFLCVIYMAFTVIGFSGCDMYPTYTWELPMSFDTVEEVLDYIVTIEYKSDGAKDNWQLPDQTYRKGTGDCEDKAILFLYIMRETFGGKAELLVVKRSGTYHVLPRHNNIVYETSVSAYVYEDWIYHWDYEKKWSLKEAIRICRDI